jgi:hypothetical protein
MGKGLQHLFVCLAIVTIVSLGAACGSDEVEDSSKKDDISKSVEKLSEEKVPRTDEDVRVSTQNISRTDSVHEALNEASESQGIFFGEVPEGFPIAFLPLYPGGTIDKSSIRGREATLLQVVPVPKDKAIAYYRNYYRELGWTANDPIALADRTMVFFSGNDARVDMTLIDREGGKTFVALALY